MCQVRVGGLAETPLADPVALGTLGRPPRETLTRPESSLPWGHVRLRREAWRAA